MPGAASALPLPAVTIMAISGIQHSLGSGWIIIYPVVPILLFIIGAGCAVGSVIAALNPAVPVWKGAVAGTGVAIGAAMTIAAVIGISIALPFPPIPIGIYYVGYIALVAVAISVIYIIIRRIRRHPATSD